MKRHMDPPRTGKELPLENRSIGTQEGLLAPVGLGTSLSSLDSMK